MAQLFIPKKTHIQVNSGLVSDYIVPPLSVFNTQMDYWTKRLQFWKDIGVYNTDGREENLAMDTRRIGKNIRGEKVEGTSSFNPAVAEVLIRWYSLPGMTVFDPFAGGITRGAVSAILDREYIGIDLSARQIESNKQNWERITDSHIVDKSPKWIIGDSFSSDWSAFEADMILTCPPYWNREVYSDVPEDLSNMTTYEQFLFRYSIVIQKCYRVLKDDSFFCIVVSDVRDKNTTEYIGLVADTVKIAQKYGFKFMNEIILMSPVWNYALTCGDYLDRARKVARQHQNILIFYKGNTKHIGEKFKKFEK